MPVVTVALDSRGAGAGVTFDGAGAGTRRTGCGLRAAHDARTGSAQQRIARRNMGIVTKDGG